RLQPLVDHDPQRRVDGRRAHHRIGGVLGDADVFGDRRRERFLLRGEHGELLRYERRRPMDQPDHREVVAVGVVALVQDDQHRLAEGRQNGFRTRSRAELGDERLRGRRDGGHHRLLLAGEVVEEGPQRDVGLAGDPFDGDVLDSVADRQAERGLAQGGPGGLLLAFAPSRRGHAQVTGREWTPKISISFRTGIFSAGTVRRRSGRRVISSRRPICSSMRASCWPRHWWTPWPNARWGLRGRRTSSRSGSGHWRGSRLTSGVATITVAPAGMSTPPRVTGAVVTRLTPSWMMLRWRS